MRVGAQLCDQSRQSEGFRQSSQVCLLPWSAQVRAGVSFSVPSGGFRGFWKRRQVCPVPYQLDRGPLRCSQAAPTESLLLFNGLAVIGWFSPGVDISELQGIGLLLSSSSPFLLFFPLNLMLQVQLHKTHFCESAAPSDLLSLVSVSFFQLRWNLKAAEGSGHMLAFRLSRFYLCKFLRCSYCEMISYEAVRDPNNA